MADAGLSPTVRFAAAQAFQNLGRIHRLVDALGQHAHDFDIVVEHRAGLRPRVVHDLFRAADDVALNFGKKIFEFPALGMIAGRKEMGHGTGSWHWGHAAPTPRLALAA